eukprot:1432088-Heterocapsa_arctica.AAC.1
MDEAVLAEQGFTAPQAHAHAKAIITERLLEVLADASTWRLMDYSLMDYFPSDGGNLFMWDTRVPSCALELVHVT